MGKPVYNKFTDMSYGAWLKDPNPRNDDYAEKIWSTSETDPYHVFEYASKAVYRNGNPRTINLRNPFRVRQRLYYKNDNDHII